jgi:hypothetical protein
MKAILSEGRLFRKVFDREMFRTAIHSLDRKPVCDLGRTRRARMLGLKTDCLFPGGPETLTEARS